MKDRDNEKCTQIKKEPISILSPNTAKNLQLVKNHTITSYLTFSICLARRILCSVPAGVFVVGIHFFFVFFFFCLFAFNSCNSNDNNVSNSDGNRFFTAYFWLVNTTWKYFCDTCHFQCLDTLYQSTNENKTHQNQQINEIQRFELLCMEQVIL